MYPGFVATAMAEEMTADPYNARRIFNLAMRAEQVHAGNFSDTLANLDDTAYIDATYGVVYRCPVCGEVVTSLPGRCPICGTDGDLFVIYGAYIVTFVDWNGTKLNKQIINDGSAATAPADPARTGYTFTGWDTDFSNVISDLTVTAQYAINFYQVTVNDSYADTSGEGSYAYNATVTISAGTRSGYNFNGWTVNSGGVSLASASSATTTFTLPASAVTVTANWVYTGGSTTGGGTTGGGTPSTTTTDEDDDDDVVDIDPDPGPPLAEAWVNPYSDVTADDWFYDVVRYVTERGLMNGTKEDLFSPNVDLSRAMIVTILWRLEGEPDAGGQYGNFTDVEEDSWYEAAVYWAAKNEIVLGFPEGVFKPGDPVTREQAVTIMFRYARFKELDVSAAADLSAFVDADDISDWALDALQWAVAVGIIEGLPGNMAAPKGTCTRAEIATIFMRYIEDFLGAADDVDPDE